MLRLLLPWRSALFAGALALFGSASLSSGCAGSPKRSGAWCPPSCGSSLPPAMGVAPVASASGGAAPAEPAVPPPIAVSGGFDPNAVTLVLDDPRLVAARESAGKEAYPRAAQELEAAMSATKLEGDERAAWLYALGRLRALGGDPLGAAKAYDDAAAQGGPLEDHARFAAAGLLEDAGQHDEALARVKAIKATLGVARDVELVTADALAGKGDVDGAAAIWRAQLAAGKPSGWVGLALKFGKALLQHPSEEHAEEAIAIARRVIYESGGGQGVAEARAIEDSAMGSIPFARRKRFEHPSGEELLGRAKGLIASLQLREALKVTDALVALPKSDRPGELPCEAYMIRGEALSKLKKKPEAADAYGDAIERCAGLPRKAEALFNGGRSAGQAGRWPLSMTRYEMLEKEFPDHRLADDARLRGAKAALELGDEARFQRMLASMPDDYPKGDLVGDGLFELALARIEKHDWAGAVAPLEQGDKRMPRERAYYAAGRFAYFLGRARLELGQVEQGTATLVRVLEEYPLSFYMALAYARLAERDRPLAEKTLHADLEKEPPGPFVIAASPALQEPAFLRATWLVRVGEPKLARAELDKLGVSARTAAPEVVWAAAFLLARGGAARDSHNMLRGATSASGASRPELAEWVGHYPAGAWRAPWEVAYPRPYAEIVARESKRQGIPQALAYAIMREESTFDPRVVSGAGAVGLMQLMVKTATAVGKPLGLPGDADSLKRPEVNIALGCHYLAQLRGKFTDDPLLAIPGYNAGDNAPKTWVSKRPSDDFDVFVERIPYEETRQYTKRVMTSMAAYELLYAPDQPTEARSSPLAVSPLAKAAAAIAQTSTP